MFEVDPQDVSEKARQRRREIMAEADKLLAEKFLNWAQSPSPEIPPVDFAYAKDIFHKFHNYYRRNTPGGSWWVFETIDNEQLFNTEEEALTVQREFRLARGLDPETGKEI